MRDQEKEIKEIDDIVNEIEEKALTRYLDRFSIDVQEIWREIDKMNTELKNIKNILGIVGGKDE